MTEEQYEAIKTREFGRTEAENWRRIFQVLFPNAPLPNSPCGYNWIPGTRNADTHSDIDRTLANDVGDFYAYFQRYAPAEIQESLRLCGIPIDLVTYGNNLEQALHRSIARVMSNYSTTSVDANSSTPLASYSSERDGSGASNNTSSDIANDIQTLEHVNLSPLPATPISSGLEHVELSISVSDLQSPRSLCKFALRDAPRSC